MHDKPFRGEIFRYRKDPSIHLLGTVRILKTFHNIFYYYNIDGDRRKVLTVDAGVFTLVFTKD